MQARLTRPRGLALAVAALAAAVALGAILAPHSTAGSTAPAAQLRAVTLGCGAVVTMSTKLASDVTGCAQSALVVTGKNVTLNLNGHLVQGTGPYGIAASAANDTIENGRVTGFITGVALLQDGSRAQNLRISNSEDGITVTAASDVITGNTVFKTSSYGITGGLGVNGQYTNNTVQSATVDGMRVLGANATVSGNRVTSNGQDGIDVEGDGAKVTGNFANGNGGDGILVDDDEVTLAKNQAFFNTKLGIDGEPGDTDAGGNRAGSNGSAHQCSNLICS